MQTAETVLSIIRERGQRGLPLERVYRHLYNQDLYLRAYGKLYTNKGAMTPGVTPETVDGMSLRKIETIIEDVRQERYHWTPVRRSYINKKQATKQRPLGQPTWSDKLLQEVIRSILEAYYDPTFSHHAHGFRPGRGCHTALPEISRHWRGVTRFIELDIRACFDSLSHTHIETILRETIYDNRFIRLIKNLLKAGYLEDWHYHQTYSGVPQGSICSPILANLVLDKLDKFVEQQLIPTYTQGHRRKTNPPYVALTKAAWQARQIGDRETARKLSQQAQTIPSRDPNDPNFRRLWYVRYADDALLGFTGSKTEAKTIKDQLTDYLQRELSLTLNQQKTLITHARTDQAQFLGYEIQTLHANSQHDHRGQRSINGGIGLRVPRQVIITKSAAYMHHGKPIHLPQYLNNDPYTIITVYQTQYRGLAQYYQLAYNLSALKRLKGVMEQSLVKTLANKFKTSRRKIYQRFQSQRQVDGYTYKVLAVTVDRGPDKTPLTAHFGGIPLRWNKHATIKDLKPPPIWNERTELVERLLAQECELCGATDNIEVHHVRKLADLKRNGQKDKPEWVQIMIALQRKTLVVCQTCHHQIHSGRYDGPKLTI